MQGLSRTNLLYTRAFANTYPEEAIVQQAAGQNNATTCCTNWICSSYATGTVKPAFKMLVNTKTRGSKSAAACCINRFIHTCFVFENQEDDQSIVFQTLQTLVTAVPGKARG